MSKIAKFLITAFVVLLVIVFFAILKQFESLDKIDTDKKPYNLPAGTILALNIRSNKIDTIKLEGYHILNFWATWCKPCIREFPSLQLLMDSIPEYNVLLFSFDSLQAQQRLIAKLNVNIPAYFISDTSIFKFPELLPKTFLLRDSTVIREIFGMKNWQDSSTTKYFN